MPIVNMPDGTPVSFPDDMPKEQIRGMIASKFPEVAQEFQPQRTAEPQGYIPAEPGLKDYARTGFDNLMQGSTLGFADEVTDRIGAGIAALGTDRTYDEMLQEARKTTKDRQAEQLQEMPVTTIGSQLAGALITGKAAGGTAAGQKFAQGTGKAADKVAALLRRGKVGRNVVQDMLAAAPASAAYSIGTAEDGKRLTGDTLRDTAMGVATAGVASAVASKVLPKLTGKKAPKMTSQELRKIASKQYDEAAKLGGTLKPEFVDDIITNIDGLKKQTKAGAIFQGDDVLTDVTARLKAVRDSGEAITLDAFQEIDESLGDLISKQYGAKDFKAAGKLMDVQTALRSAVESADESMIDGGAAGFKALKEGRKTWSQLRKMEDVERIIDRASRMEQPATGIKSGFRTLLANPKRMRGFTEDERKAIEKAANTGVLQDVFRMFGSRLVPIGATVAGGGLGPAAAATALSTASRGAGAKMQVNKAAEVANIIANGGKAPVKQIGPSLTDLLMAPK